VLAVFLLFTAPRFLLSALISGLLSATQARDCYAGPVPFVSLFTPNGQLHCRWHTFQMTSRQLEWQVKLNTFSVKDTPSSICNLDIHSIFDSAIIVEVVKVIYNRAVDSLV
jgi:hypothetical protein